MSGCQSQTQILPFTAAGPGTGRKRPFLTERFTLLLCKLRVTDTVGGAISIAHPRLIDDQWTACFSGDGKLVFPEDLLIWKTRET